MTLKPTQYYLFKLGFVTIFSKGFFFAEIFKIYLLNKSLYQFESNCHRFFRSPHMEGAVPLADAFRSLIAWTADAGEAARPVSPPGPMMVAAVTGKPTEASITQIFQKFDANQDGKLDINELQHLLTSLVSGTETLPAVDVEGLLKSIKEKDSESGSGIRYEEFIAWIFGAPCFMSDPDVGSDGETDAIMDPPSLIRMSSDAQYGEGVKVPENEKDSCLSSKDAGGYFWEAEVAKTFFSKGCGRSLQHSVGDSEFF